MDHFLILIFDIIGLIVYYTLRVSHTWHDMAQCGQAKFLLAVTSGGQHGGAKPPALDFLQGDLHRHSACFRSFHLIPQRFSTSETADCVAYCGILTRQVVFAEQQLHGILHHTAIQVRTKFLNLGFVDLVGVQGAHSQREECRNDDERLETQIVYDLP